MDEHPGFDNFDHPKDTALSAGLRFLTELIAWIAGPWAAAAVGAWLAVPVLVVLIGLPSVFSTIGDKRKVIVATPGPVRVSIELVLFFVAAIAPWLSGGRGWRPAARRSRSPRSLQDGRGSAG